jgi:murein DD-endopeptidase MepM/ murein hydrolase activator NlpD
MKNDIPRAAVDDLIRIFAYDVDFQKRVTGGDTFEVFYAEDEDTPGRLEILYASLTTGGEQRQVYRFQSNEDGSVEYFDQDGKSLKKFLLRKPIADAELRSGFGMRYHPILRYSKMHTGVDWGSRVGTPILASGNGVVTKVGWTSGYGRHTEIQHTNGYVTTYSHQSAFAKGIAPGAKVRQGQVIGFVGSTGLSTGPHLHYEVLVNGHFVNPMKIKVPRGRELDGRALAEFTRQRDQVNTLLAKASNTKLAAQ